MGTTTEVIDKFDLSGKCAVITGGAGLLGVKHAEALMEFGAHCLLVDIDENRAKHWAEELSKKYPGSAKGLAVDITNARDVSSLLEESTRLFDNVCILINNAANNPKYESIQGKTDPSSRFETFPLKSWEADISVGLTGAFLCAQVFGTHFADQGAGVILNISSDLGIIAPDQRIYRQDSISDESSQPTKPVTYPVIKAALIGLTRYVATYWAHAGVRCNALVPGGVYTGQDDTFVAKLTNLIPMGRMATPDEYKAAVAFLCSDASAYMTGASLVIEGGRTCW